MRAVYTDVTLSQSKLQQFLAKSHISINQITGDIQNKCHSLFNSEVFLGKLG